MFSCRQGDHCSSRMPSKFPLQKGEARPQCWTFPERGYYDLTPPCEISEPQVHLGGGYVASEQLSERHRGTLVAVVGVGYVGEYLMATFSKCFPVLGYDISEKRTLQLEKDFAGRDNIKFARSAKELAVATHFLIAVPTLLLPDKTIDSSFLRSALAAVGNFAERGSVVVIESSVAVGMTREFLGPLAHAKGFFAGMSPERVDPGRTEPPSHAIPKIISGLDDITPGSLAVIESLYSRAFNRVVPVSSPEVAEMTKLYENCQRMICIAYANEMADACQARGIDPWEVCDAASTKPFGYLSIHPGPGVGGHCIPVNPYYLLANNDFPLLQAASEKMGQRPVAIAKRVARELRRAECQPLVPRVLVAGIGFKPGQSHLANSPGLELARSLVLMGEVDVWWIDPLVEQEAVPQIPMLELSEWKAKSLEQNFHMIIVAIRQHGLDYSLLSVLRGVEVEIWCR